MMTAKVSKIWRAPTPSRNLFCLWAHNSVDTLPIREYYADMQRTARAAKRQKQPHLDLRLLRQAKRLSISQVADAIGIANSSLSRIETGRFIPQHDIACNLADYYGVDVRAIDFPAMGR